MSSDRAPAERPDQTNREEIDPTEETGHGLANITTAPGDRKTDDTWMLVVEAELVADGAELDNPAKPRTASVGEEFAERLDKHEDDLAPAWRVMAEQRREDRK